VVTLVFGVCLVAASGASAAAPLKGRVYVSDSSVHPVVFEVSANGKSISGFHISLEFLSCNGASGATSATTATVKNGKFTIRLNGSGITANTATGKFGAHGSVSGTVKESAEGAFGSGSCHTSFAWKARALPISSRLCPDHIGPPHTKGEDGTATEGEAEDLAIIATNIGCTKVDNALDAGKFKFDDFTTTRVSTFTTSGWACSETASDVPVTNGHGNRYKCSHAAHHASFAFAQNSTPCGIIGRTGGTQCDLTGADVRPRP
jgi:hypothetical protein